MSQIDWSKAPEGAEFWNPHTELFYRSADGELQKFSETRGRWTLASGERHEYQTLIAKPAQWNGEGLPHVGAVCELRFNTDQVPAWSKVEILYLSERSRLFNFIDDCEDLLFGHEDFSDMAFRPIRTPEQIAAEERKKSAVALYEAVMNFGNLAFDRLPLDRQEHYLKLVDAGWQQVKP